MNKTVELHAALLIATLPDEAYIKLPTVLALFDVSKSHWYRGMKQGIYPKQVKLNRSSRWIVGEIRDTLIAPKANR